MTHGAQESRLGRIGFLCPGQRFRKHAVLFHCFPRFPVNIGEARSDPVDDPVFTVLDAADARDPQHLIPLLVIDHGQVSVGKHNFFGQTRADVLRFYELKEPVPVLLRHTVFRIFGEALAEREFFPGPHPVGHFRGSAVADALVPVQISVVNAPVIRRHRRDHAVPVPDVCQRLVQVGSCEVAVACNGLKSMVNVFNLITGMDIQLIQQTDVVLSVLFGVVAEAAGTA